MVCFRYQRHILRTRVITTASIPIKRQLKLVLSSTLMVGEIILCKFNTSEHQHHETTLPSLGEIYFQYLQGFHFLNLKLSNC